MLTFVFFREDNICPVDLEPIQPDEIFADKVTERKILSLHCKCKFHHHGCEWIGQVSAFEVSV